MTGTLKPAALTLVAILLLLPGRGEAAIVAHLDDGNTGAAVDGYPGMAGDGWAGAWDTDTSNASFTAGPTVISTSPLSPGGGNYLNMTISAGGAGGQAATGRQYETFGDVDVTEPHAIRFQLRAEDLTGFTSQDDRLQIYSRPTIRYGTDAACQWVIYAMGGTRSDTNWEANQWTFFDGHKDGGGFYVDQYVNSGVALVAGTTYDFEVTVYPDAREWDVSVSDGTNSFSQGGLGFRSSSSSLATLLNFGARGSSSSDARDFSIDAIEIRQIAPAIRADFTQGNGSTYVDQYGGAGGKGWNAGWSSYGSFTAGVATANPIDPADPPYLSARSTGSGNETLARRFLEYGQVDPAEPYRVTWTWRFDGDLEDMTTFNDRIHFYANDAGVNGTKTSNSWIIGWAAASSSTNPVHEGKWYFFDGTGGSSFEASNMVNTGMDLVEGRVYDFEVWVYPERGTYDAWIFDGTAGFSAKGLGFRNGTPGQYNVLHFGGSASSGADWAFSLDAIQVSQVPEPATCTLALVGIALAAGFAGRRRSRKGQGD